MSSIAAKTSIKRTVPCRSAATLLLLDIVREGVPGVCC